MRKRPRHFAIKEILGSLDIKNQRELRRELKKRGFSVTQATLSRDLHELGVGRAVSGQGVRYSLQPQAEVQILQPLVGAEVVSIQANESIIVVRTLPGCANTVGEFLDVQDHPAIIGTVAGDNTLLIIPKSERKTGEVTRFLRNKLIEGK